jgi:hypothetical protein
VLVTRWLWIAASCLALCGCGHAHLLGSVRDQVSAEPVVGAQVSVEGTPAPVETDSEGWFEVDLDSRTKPYRVVIEADGYEELSEEVTVGHHEESYEFDLVPR